MPTLTKPEMNITLVAGSPEVTVRVHGMVTLTPEEKAAIAAGWLKPLLRVEIWGEDDAPNPDDRLFTLATLRPTDTMAYDLSHKIRKSWLNEDRSFFEGGPGDEIYAKVIYGFTSELFPTKPPIVARSKTQTGKF